MSKLSVNELTDETGSGAPSFPNGVSVTGAALTDPEITGGIYLGGTGAANYLDDYEEGTWTPNVIFSNGSSGLSFSVLAGSYTKVGRFVHIAFTVIFSSKGSGSGRLEITNPPFVVGPVGGTLIRHRLNIGYADSNSAPRDVYVQRNGNIRFQAGSDRDHYSYSMVANDTQLYVSGTYFTDS